MASTGDAVAVARSTLAAWPVSDGSVLSGCWRRCGVSGSSSEGTGEWGWMAARARRESSQRVCRALLAMLDAAVVLADLRVPPGNRLEKLSGDRAGQYSIRINRQWRICFRWSDAGPDDVEIVDYH